MGYGDEKIALDNTPHGPALSEMIRAALLSDKRFVESVEDEISRDREAEAVEYRHRVDRPHENSTYRAINGSV